MIIIFSFKIRLIERFQKMTQTLPYKVFAFCTLMDYFLLFKNRQINTLKGVTFINLHMILTKKVGVHQDLFKSHKIDCIIFIFVQKMHFQHLRIHFAYIRYSVSR